MSVEAHPSKRPIPRSTFVAQPLDTTGVANWYNALGAAARAALGATIQGTLIPIQAGSQADFAYNYLNPNGSNQFNFWTFQYISALAQAGAYPGTASLNSGANAFTLATQQLTNQIAFVLSTADQAALTAAQNASQTQQLNVINTYETLYGPVTQAMIDAAAAWLGAQRTKFNYIITYVVGGQWAGKTAPPALTWTRMRTAPSLSALLPEAPPDSPPVLASVSAYLNIIGPITSLFDQQSLGNYLLNAVKQALLDPANNNAGMVTFNPTNPGDTKNVAAWAISKSMQQIQNELAGTSTITMAMSLSEQSENVYNVSINGGASFTTGGPFVTYSISGSSSYDMTSIQGSGKSIGISVSYKGYATIPVAPQTLIPGSGTGSTGSTGWYFARMIAEANKNWQLDTNAPTGFKFVNQPSLNLNPFPTGAFNTLTTLLISSYPSITINYSAGDYNLFKQVFTAQASGSVRIFGIPVGSASMSTYSSKLQQGSTNQSFSVTFAPPSPTGIVLSQQTAYVIGSVIDSPGTPTTPTAERLEVSKGRSVIEDVIESLV